MLKKELMQLLGVRGVQARVARDLSLSATTVNKWAMGYNLPEPERLPALEQSLGVPAGHLSALVMPPAAETVIDELRGMLRQMGDVVRRLEDRVAELEGQVSAADPPSRPPRRAVRSTAK